MFEIRYIDNDLNEGTLIRFSRKTSAKRAIDTLNQLAKDWNMRFVKDTTVFGGYYVRPDGICYFVK